MKRLVFLSAICLSLISCATPSEHFTAVANKLNFRHSIISTALFDHRIYTNNRFNNIDNNEALHVYLDGDGTPWQQHRWIADDPTSRNPLVLELINQDRNPSVLLGRPCYHGLNDTIGCHQRYWTSHRYSAEVVYSMVSALNIILENHPFNKVVLIGYSGGGVLSMLMAPYFPDLEKIVTVAANLDIAAWSDYHGYLPMSGSINPASEHFQINTEQIHFAGMKDQAVPMRIIKQFAEEQIAASFITYKTFDHRCCWADEWPIILKLF